MSMHRDFPVMKILQELGRDNLLPAILFRTARRQCDEDIERLARSRNVALAERERAHLLKEIAAIMAKYAMPEDVIKKHPHFAVLTTVAVGAHHAGQLLMWRLLLEELMSRGLLRLLIATGTVAAGVDFPARTVVVTAHSKRGSEGFAVLTAAEFQQMSGRAGRRGKDAVGICLVAPSQFSDARVLSEVAMSPPEPLNSAYFAAPSTVLNLLRYRSVEDLHFVVSRSFAAFLDKKQARLLRAAAQKDRDMIVANGSMPETAKKKAAKRIHRQEREADEIEGKQVGLLENSLQALRTLGFLDGGKLTEKGVWSANLCTSVVLELAEAIDSGMLYQANVPLLVGLVASIAGDPHRDYYRLSKNPIDKSLYAKMQELIDRVRAVYVNPYGSEVRALPDAALTVLTWMEASSWQEFSGLLRLNGVAEGDVARLVSQTAEHLNQISKLYETHPDLATAAAEGRAKLLRPPLTESLPVL